MIKQKSFWKMVYKAHFGKNFFLKGCINSSCGSQFIRRNRQPINQHKFFWSFLDGELHINELHSDLLAHIFFQPFDFFFHQDIMAVYFLLFSSFLRFWIMLNALLDQTLWQCTQCWLTNHPILVQGLLVIQCTRIYIIFLLGALFFYLAI